MTSRLTGLLLASALTTLPAAAWAQCATVDPVLVPRIEINPLDAAGPAELAQPFGLTFRRTGAGTEPLVLRYQIVDEDSDLRSRVGLSQGPVVEWQGADSSRNIGAFRGEAYALLRSGEVAFGENEVAARTNVIMRLTDLRQDLAAGVYREQFTVRYWCGSATETVPYEAHGLVATTVAVPNVLSANIAGASARGRIDFQDFAILSRNLQVSVRSTGPYKVSAQSLNGGELRREGASGSQDADRIRYAALFDGQALAMDGAARPMFRSGLVGRQIALDIRVEGVEDKRAGAYADTLLLTLTPAN